jgi:hypothetical protein
MRSFALWYLEKSKDLDPAEVTVNINLWDRKRNQTKNYCFDFGFLIDDITRINKVNLYVPFQIEKKHIKDLGEVISNNKLINAIFNENYNTTDGEPKRIIVNTEEEDDDFVIYSLEVDKQVDIQSCKSTGDDPGSILSIDVSDIEPSKLKKIKKYYFRIRIEVAESNIKLIYNEIKGVSIFSNQFTNTEVIDFRLNDIRSCSEELREQFDKGSKFNMKAIHYLILRNANDAIIHYGKEIHSRMLENNLWKTYIENEKDNIIAYHIKSKAKKKFDQESNKYYDVYLKDFSDLTRFQYEKNTGFIIFLYVMGILVLGVIGGIIGNFISSMFGF